MTQPPLRRAAHAQASTTEPAAAGQRQRARWPWAAAAVIGVVAIGSAAYAMSNAGDKSQDRTAAPAQSASGTAESSGITLHKTGADGVFMITVTGLRCGVKKVGPDELRQTAAGQYCLVDLTVENAGKEAKLLDGGAQRAVDSKGKAYAVADAATVFVNDQNPTLLDEIAPGKVVRGSLPFDVPAGTQLSALIVHESAGSKGARIPLS